MKVKIKLLLIEYVGHIGLRSLTDGHLGSHLEYFKTLNDARVASVGFDKYNTPTTRIIKEKNFKIKFKVILVFYWTNNAHYQNYTNSSAPSNKMTTRSKNINTSK